MWRLIILFLCLGGCATASFQRYSYVDISDKTITVPIVGQNLQGALKKTLNDLGWKLVVDKGPDVTEGSLGDQTKLESYNTFNTRYRLYVTATQLDLCFNFTPKVEYTLSFIDNKNGTEVFTMEGYSCQSKIVQDFKNALEERDYK